MTNMLTNSSRWLTLLATIALGLSAGASLAQAALLVPFWKSLSPEAFFQWYGANSARLVAFYSPLQIWSTVLALVAFVVLAIARHPSRWIMLAATVFALAVLGTFFLYFKDAVVAFRSGPIPADQISATLQTWGNWQWVRVALQVCAFCCCALALAVRPKSPG